jgi:hypothetical protein
VLIAVARLDNGQFVLTREHNVIRIMLIGALTLSLGWRLGKGAEGGLPEYRNPSTSEFRCVSWAEDGEHKGLTMRKPSRAMTAMLGLETYVRRCGLERSVLELVKSRASQINGCAMASCSQ